MDLNGGFAETNVVNYSAEASGFEADLGHFNFGNGYLDFNFPGSTGVLPDSAIEVVLANVGAGPFCPAGSYGDHWQ